MTLTAAAVTRAIWSLGSSSATSAGAGKAAARGGAASVPVGIVSTYSTSGAELCTMHYAFHMFVPV